jgi:hypothetical protein
MKDDVSIRSPHWWHEPATLLGAAASLLVGAAAAGAAEPAAAAAAAAPPPRALLAIGVSPESETPCPSLARWRHFRRNLRVLA